LRGLISDGLRREILRANQAYDSRLISNGTEIPTLSYADQPYIVKAKDSALVCLVTTGAGHEGAPGQHIVALRSEDNGVTWSSAIAIESPDGVESSYVVPLITPAGRIYAFYNHNTDNVRKIPGDKPAYPDGWCRRVDSLGYFVFKYSDDHGRSWSEKRYTVPVREFEIDRQNTSDGKIRYFWNVGKAFAYSGKGYIPLHKVGGFGEGFFTRSEGVLLCSDNILTETDPEKICFETLPDGDIGLRAPAGGGPIAEEQSFVVLSDGTFFCVYRTVDGAPACCYSRDRGHHWSAPDYLRYPDGRIIKHPRAANFIWKLSGNRYLYWFHNHGGKGYEDRNPVWCIPAHETDSREGKVLTFGQPEILFYDDDPFIRMSYPDLIELNGSIYITETQKNTARIHKISDTFIRQLWDIKNIIDEPKCLLDVKNGGVIVDLPGLPCFCQRDIRRVDHGKVDLRQGITLIFTFYPCEKSTLLLDCQFVNRRGWSLCLCSDGHLELKMSDGQTQSLNVSEPSIINFSKENEIAVVIDGGPKIVSYIINGSFCDGDANLQFGWSRFSPHLRDMNGQSRLTIHPEVRNLKIFDKALMTTEILIMQRRAGDNEK